MDVHADLSLHWAHMSEGTFSHVGAHILKRVLTLTVLWANSADNKLTLFFLFCLGYRILHFTQIVSSGDNLHELSDHIF